MSRQKVFDLLRFVSREIIDDDVDLPSFRLVGNDVGQESRVFPGNAGFIYREKTAPLMERQPFVAPEGTLFLLGPSDVFLTTLDGREATITWADLAAFFRHLVALETLALEEGTDAPFQLNPGSLA